MQFKHKALTVLAGALLLSTPLSAWALHLGNTTNGHPAAGVYETEDVRNTLHNLGDTIAGFNNPNILPTAGNTNEVCAFCHTPHGANTSAPGAAPLWNRQINIAGGYGLYSSPNFDTVVPNQPQGVSLACLSCHDGTFAVDALVNAGGSGGFRGLTPASANLVDAQGATTLIDSATGQMMAGSRSTAGEANYDPITGGTGAEPFPNLTINLSDDHPISMPMCVGVSSPCPDPQFDTTTPTDDGSITRLRRGAVADAPTDKRDSIRLYGPMGANANNGDRTDFVECASCHNPHAPRPLFLRLPSAIGVVATNSNTAIPAAWGGGGVWGDNPNKGSAICLSCHQK